MSRRLTAFHRLRIVADLIARSIDQSPKACHPDLALNVEQLILVILSIRKAGPVCSLYEVGERDLT